MPIALDVEFIEDDPGLTILSFSTLEVGLYRFTVSDAITDESGDALDGDGDGIPGGDWILETEVIPTGPIGGGFE